ncbi:MAG: polysaccharide deacetylase family protein [Chitinophagales bacterium]|nr:polysaccharide deacetylase family protein [Chitinophagales bacterium]MDW8428842.1 polysaccharide deacetylase family protein [Chitinophagales bacterium]
MMTRVLRPMVAGAFYRLGVATLLRLQRKNTITLLCFHRVNEEKNWVWPGWSWKRFEQLICILRKKYQVCALGPELCLGNGNKLVLTFDDGYYDFIEFVLPVLKKYRLPAVHHVTVDSVLTGLPNWTYMLNLVVDDHLKSKRRLEIEELKYSSFITPKNAERESLRIFHGLKKLPYTSIRHILERLMHRCVGDLYLPRMMRPNDLQECLSNGVAIGSHGYDHLVLHDQLPADALHREIVQSKQKLEQLTGTVVESFAFVNGEFFPQAIKQCREAGYQYLLTTLYGFARCSSPAKTLPELLPRLQVPPYSIAETLLYIEGFHQLVSRYVRAR